jgi:pilus assembly protein Flp/PilA
MRNLLKNFLEDQSGATAIEYGLIAAILGVGIAASILSVRGSLTAKYMMIQTEVSK